jgi:hypothetical protein
VKELNFEEERRIFLSPKKNKRRITKSTIGLIDEFKVGTTFPKR